MSQPNSSPLNFKTSVSSDNLVRICRTVKRHIVDDHNQGIVVGYMPVGMSVVSSLFEARVLADACSNEPEVSCHKGIAHALVIRKIPVEFLSTTRSSFAL
jgi:hypothetical protein